MFNTLSPMPLVFMACTIALNAVALIGSHDMGILSVSHAATTESLYQVIGDAIGSFECAIEFGARYLDGGVKPLFVI